MGFLKAAILLHLLLLIRLSLNLVSADETLIEGECQNAKVPSICIQCLKSDPAAEHTDTKGLAAIMTNCVSNQADQLAVNMSDMAATETDYTVRTVYELCERNFVYAKQDITNAKVALMKNNLGESLKSLADAVERDFACRIAILMLITRIPKPTIDSIFNTMSDYIDLAEAANSVIGSLFHR